MYKQELKAIKNANLYRERELYHDSLVDLASNDYLGFSEDFDIFDKAVAEVKKISGTFSKSFTTSQRLS